MKENFNDGAKEWWPLKNGISLVRLEYDAGVVDLDIAKKIKQVYCQLGSCILGHSKRLMNIVIREIDGFYCNNVYYGDTDSAYFHEKYLATLIEKGYVGNCVGLGQNVYGTSGIFYAWLLGPKIKYCRVIEDLGVISAKRWFKGCSEEQRMMKLDEYM